MKLKDRMNLLKFKLLAHRRTISPKGDYYIHYIIDKYVNATKPDDYIEAYEQMISKHEKHTKNTEIFQLFLSEENDENIDAKIHFLAANIALAMVFMSIQESEITKYLDLITNPSAKEFINRISHPDKKWPKGVKNNGEV